MNEKLLGESKGKCFIGGCVMNCGFFLDKIFSNFQLIGASGIFDDIRIILAYDASHDNSLEKCYEYQGRFASLEKPIFVDVLINKNLRSSYRAENIGNARNMVLDRVKKYKNEDSLDEWKYFIMCDTDRECSYDMNLDVLQKYLVRDDWDALSFNRMNYYDIWALAYNPFYFSCWHWEDQNIWMDIRNDISWRLAQLDKDSLFECSSAFNGFAIYRLSKFLNCYYDFRQAYNYMDDSLIAINDEIFRGRTVRQSGEKNNNEDCEHKHFHLQAIALNGAKIRISPLCFFRDT
jgi:hypothetical protein